MADPRGTTTHQTGQQSSARPKHLELPTPTGPSRLPKQNSLHLLPATALFHGPHSRNGSRSSLNRSAEERTPATPSQHLPRANPPTASFSGPSRPSQLKEVTTANLRPFSGAPVQIFAPTSKKQDDFRADAVWAEMQKTLADVELSAINSSHVFGDTHAKALEDLRAAQLGLAQAWAKSEADEMVEEEFGRDENENGAVGQSKGAFFGTSARPGSKGHSRNASIASNVSGSGERAVNMEEETERDIRLARRRREANDRYFKQVNRGVVDVVRKLDDVTTAMRRVEKESREIWNESSGSEDLGDVTETDQSTQTKKEEKIGRPRAATDESALSMETDTDLLSSSPESKR